MKIVTYNVNGLRQRISQFGSLLKLVDSFDADIICFQETKLRRQELTADVVMADGYESFFSCTRTSEKGRTGYSGVATFCRVKSAFSSCEAALPVAAEEGITGLVNSNNNSNTNNNNSNTNNNNDNTRAERDEVCRVAEGLEEFERDELLKVDSEGRCVITDHHHFVVFNLYGPRAEADDSERIQFKLKFFKILERRWEQLLCQGRRIFVVGDLNIAPFAMDRCDAGPDFEKNEFRKWFRSILLEPRGPFSDVFRARHPDRKEAYTCWPSNTGAEQFNYGTRIDHILFAGSCLHQDQDRQGHNFLACHVKECDILTQYKRVKPGNAPRWKGGWGIKLEGSDHVPVYTSFEEMPDVPEHSTPSLSSRYLPMIYGLQQTLVSVLMKRRAAKQVEALEISQSSLDGSFMIATCSQNVKRPSDMSHEESRSSWDPKSEISSSGADKKSRGTVVKTAGKISLSLGSEKISRNGTRKRVRKNQFSQLSLKSFFARSSSVHDTAGVSLGQEDIPTSSHQSCETHAMDDPSSRERQYELESSILKKEDEKSSNLEESELTPSSAKQEEDKENGSPSVKQKNDAALLEWQRIRQLMQNSIPLCKGHKEPCVARVVKKPGPTFGRRFYVCARAEGPSSNPEANCGYFKWASSKFREK